MATGFEIQLTGLNAIDALIENVPEKLKDAQNKFGLNVVRDAKQLVPVDNGRLKNSISYQIEGSEVEIIAATNYAAYIEFGTRGYAEKYVSSLPQDWQTFAKQFQGKTGGGMDNFFMAILEWVKSKGIGATTFSVKTKKRTGSKQRRDSEDFDAAYPIALAILRKGIKAQPFIYPAINNNIEAYKDDLKKLLQK